MHAQLIRSVLNRPISAQGSLFILSLSRRFSFSPRLAIITNASFFFSSLELFRLLCARHSVTRVHSCIKKSIISLRLKNVQMNENALEIYVELNLSEHNVSPYLNSYEREKKCRCLRRCREIPLKVDNAMLLLFSFNFAFKPTRLLIRIAKHDLFKIFITTFFSVSAKPRISDINTARKQKTW